VFVLSNGFTPILNLIEENPAWKELVAAVEKDGNGGWTQVPEAAKPYVIAALYQRLKKSMLVITAQPENAKTLSE